MKLKYWIVIILVVTAGLISWYYYATSQATPCYNKALVLNQIKGFPTPTNNKCPEGYTLDSLFCAGAPIWCEPNKNLTAPTSSPTNQADTANWKTYSNSQYGFSFEYPQNGSLDQNTTNTDRGYIRIQNYSDEVDSMPANSFYIEISILDEAKGDKITQSCNQRFEVIDKNLQAPGAKVYYGTPNLGGDSGGNGYSACVDEAGIQIFITATQSNSDLTTAKLIINSLTLPF